MIQLILTQIYNPLFINLLFWAFWAQVHSSWGLNPNWVLTSSILDIMEGSCIVLTMFIMDIDIVHGAEIVS